MAFKLPSLPQIVESFERWYVDFRIWWQQVTQKIEEQEDRQDAVDIQLAATIALLDATVTSLGDALERLGLVEELADGTFIIVDQGMNPDGTIKPNKVLTESVIPEAVGGVVFEDGSDTAIPSSGSEVVIFTSSVVTVGDATHGAALCEISGQFDGTSNPDSAANFYLETNSNGAGWVRQKTAKAGARTDGADTFSYQTIYAGAGLSGVGLETVQVRIIGQAIAMPSSSLFASAILEPATRITRLAR